MYKLIILPLKLNYAYIKKDDWFLPVSWRPGQWCLLVPPVPLNWWLQLVYRGQSARQSVPHMPAEFHPRLPNKWQMANEVRDLWYIHKDSIYWKMSASQNWIWLQSPSLNSCEWYQLCNLVYLYHITHTRRVWPCLRKTENQRSVTFFKPWRWFIFYAWLSKKHRHWAPDLNEGHGVFRRLDYLFGLDVIGTCTCLVYASSSVAGPWATAKKCIIICKILQNAWRFTKQNDLPTEVFFPQEEIIMIVLYFCLTWYNI